jgi:tRNA(Ile)-lysidine synthetase-like protein
MAANILSLQCDFLQLYNEWFENKHYWFDKKEEYDKYLSDTYFHKIESIKTYNDELLSADTEIQIGAIIAFDQIPRHHNRIIEVDCFAYSQVASDIALGLMSKLSTNIYTYGNISAYEWCFILLPFRHINDISRLNTIIRFIIEKHNKDDTFVNEKPIFKKYLYKTLKHVYQINTKDALREQMNIHKVRNNEVEQWSKYASVLHNAPSAAIDMIHDADVDNDNFALYKSLCNEITGIDDENIIVSLSGGVDSCVCLYMLRQMLPYNNIAAVHINYNNRPEENQMELKFVKRFCSIFNVKLFHRTINEIQRDDCHMHGLRDLYEKITKDIRFDVYKQVANTFGNDYKTLVVLGHNMDDCFENIITNISSKCNYDNLSGISKINIISDIHFWRPMLDVRKHDILHFAICRHIPFLKNSTPTWSTRGKIRDIVLPALQNINVDIMNSFFVLKDYMSSSHKLVETYVLQDILQTFLPQGKDLVGCFECHKLICIFSIWKQIFESAKFTGFLGHKRVSVKSTNEFIKCMQRFRDKVNSKKKMKYILRNDVHVCLQENEEKVLITFSLV